MSGRQHRQSTERLSYNVTGWVVQAIGIGFVIAQSVMVSGTMNIFMGFVVVIGHEQLNFTNYGAVA